MQSPALHAPSLDGIQDPGKMRRQMAELERVELLEDPPIVEVACGCVFGELPRLDPVVLGLYWQQRRADYPGHELHPAISDSAPLIVMPGGELSLTVRQGVPPIRTWLVAENEDFLLQIQRDRFYVNWRKRGGRYPRFSTEDGVGARTIREFTLFRDFCVREIGQEPMPLQAQLTKVDHLIENRHWQTFAELSQMVPWLKDFSRFSHSGAPSIAMRFIEPRDAGSLSVALDTLPPEAVQPPALGRILKVEATATKAVAGVGALKTVLERANAEVNDVFAKLVPKEVRNAHFQRRKGEN